MAVFFYAYKILSKGFAPDFVRVPECILYGGKEKRRMKMRKLRRIVCVLMAAMVVLSGCQKGDKGSEGRDDTRNEAGLEGDSRTETEEGKEQSKAYEEQSPAQKEDEALKDKGNAEQPEEQQKTGRETITIDISKEYIGEWEGGQRIIQGTSSKLHILDEGYEDFQAVLDEYGEMDWREVQEIYQESLPTAQEMFQANGYADYDISRDISLERADSQIVSFTNTESSYMGGAHGSYYTKGVNFDPVSGQQLSLKDVVEDYDQVYAYTKEYLEREFDSEAFFPDYQDTLQAMFYGGDQGVSPLEWTMDTEKVILYFSQYVLGPYSSGAFIVELPFAAEGQQMVKEEYIAQTGGSVRRLWEWEELSVDIGTEKRELSYAIQTDEMSFTSTISLKWGQQSTQLEMYGAFEQAYLFQKADGRAWVYAECMGDNDWRTVYVFDLNQDTPVFAGETTDYIGEHLVDDPEDFVLYSHMEALGTYMGFRHYHVGDSGMPEALDETYTIVNYDRGWGEYAITSKIELPVLMHGEGTEKTQETLPAGTKFYLRRTDSGTFVEMELEDGRRCDILLEEDGYFSKINGIKEEECFDGLRYAG